MGFTDADLAILLVIAAIVSLPVLAARSFNRRNAQAPSELIQRRCHACGYDLRATPDRCPECGEPVPKTRRALDPTKLRDNWPATPIDVREPTPDEAPIVVHEPPNSMAANLVVAQLEARGIRAVVRSRQRPMRVGDYTPQGADLAVIVWADDVERAEAILARFEKTLRLN